ncbi:glutamate-5-semialdehyde dehydrogenase [bacterium]|nr:glutamate-5-semialdehyde dehydrogenase [bacterium]
MTGPQVSVTEMIENLGQRARKASRAMLAAQPAAKNRALDLAAEALDRERARIQSENAKDLASGRERGLSAAMIDRLTLTDARIDGMRQALAEIAALPDPIGGIENMSVRPNGLRIGHVRAPVGVIGIIFESRPNVTVDAAALCLKSGNAVILRGGSEAFHSNTILAELLNAAAREAGLPDGVVQLVPTTDREAVGALLKLDKYVDLIIPRGGKNLIERVTAESRIPVIKHLDGNCSVYIDEGGDHESGVRIIVNSKVSRPGVCNAAETLLVHQKEAAEFLPIAAEALRERGVELRGCERSRAIVPDMKEANEEDWYAEYLDLILAVRVVDSMEDAIEFINHYGSHHTESIVTKDYQRANDFMRRIDSACVHINCSTRFSDGGEYGLGAEIGISTDKLHARGPMGLRELTTAKWIVLGEGQVRG